MPPVGFTLWYPQTSLKPSAGDPSVGVTPVCLQSQAASSIFPYLRPDATLVIKHNCTLNATATEPTCDGLASTFNLTKDEFFQLNDDVDSNCGNLTVGNPVSFGLGSASSIMAYMHIVLCQCRRLFPRKHGHSL